MTQSLNLPGSFVTPQSVVAEKGRVYVGSYQGSLFALDGKGPNSSLELTKTVQVGSIVTSMDQDGGHVYFTGNNGNLIRVNKNLKTKDTSKLSDYGLMNVVANDKSVTVSNGQGIVATNTTSVFVSQLNVGDFAMSIDKKLQTNGKTYGSEFKEGKTVMYTQDGSYVTEITNPGFGFFNLYATDSFLALTQPGCCGTGVWLYRITPNSISFWSYLPIPHANDVIEFSDKKTGERYLIVATESSSIYVVDLNQSNPSVVSQMNLRDKLGYDHSVNIEIRSLAVDSGKRMIYAAASGNKHPDLPNFFSLRIQ